MQPLDPNEVDWNEVALNVEMASAIRAARVSSYCTQDVSDYRFAAWEGVAQALRYYDKDKAKHSFLEYSRLYIKWKMDREQRRFNGPITKKPTDKDSMFLGVNIEEIYSLAAEDNADNQFNAEDYPDLALLLAGLDERERRYVEARYMQEKTLPQIAAEDGISKQRVAQVIAKALAKMRNTAKGVKVKEISEGKFF